MREVCQRTSAYDVRLTIRLTPKSSRDKIGSIVETPEGPALQAHVRALPEDGAANKAAQALIAKWLGIPKTSVQLTSGTKSRIKTLKITANPDDVLAKLKTIEALSQ